MKIICYYYFKHAVVAKLVDALDLGSSGYSHESSSLSDRIFESNWIIQFYLIDPVPEFNISIAMV